MTYIYSNEEFAYSLYQYICRRYFVYYSLFFQSTKENKPTSVESTSLLSDEAISSITAFLMSESIASEVLSASLGGAVSATVLYPLEVLKTKMQAETKKDKVNDEDTENSENDPSEFAMIEYAQYLYKNHGMGVFFAGVETSAFQSATEKALYFFAYTIMKNAYKAVAHTKELSALTTLALGYLAEWAHLPVTLPLDCWTTKIQTDASGKDPIQLLLLMLSEKVRAFNIYEGNENPPMHRTFNNSLKYLGYSRYVQRSTSLCRVVFQACIAIYCL